MYQRGAIPMLTSTTSKVVLMIAMTMAFGVVPSKFLMCQDTTSLTGDIKQLGRGGDNLAIVRTLAKDPRVATRLLINALHPIDATEIPSGENSSDAEHVLWSIRALRYVTGGKDFCAKTDQRFGKSQEEQQRQYWIFFRYKTCASFFAMWPSRGTEYIAPRSVQEQIIKEWKDWYKSEGESFDYKPMQNPKPEQWLW
jgi:hypothetical protein